MKTQISTKLALLSAFVVFTSGSAQAALLTWWKLDEAAGSTTAADASGNSNTGNLTNFDFTADSDFDPAGGKFGGAIHFDGTNDYINNTTGFQPTGNFAYSYFFKPDEDNYAAGHGRDDHIYSNARPHFSFSRDGGGDGLLGMHFDIGGDSQSKSTTSTWSNAEWHHVAWTFDGSDVRMYVNGILESTLARPGTHTVQGDGRFNLGSNAGATAFDGFMDDLAIWDEALSAADLLVISTNGVQAFVDAQGLDSDGDNLPDTFEQAIIDADLNDGINTLADVLPGDDFDNDGSDNENELNNGTNPIDDDSDDDGLLDGAETNNGTFTSASETGSNPNDPDSDGDGINDGDEVTGANNFVTDPNKADTDGDGFDDDVEITANTDPTDENDFPRGSGKNILFIGAQDTPAQGADGAVFTFLEERYGVGSITYQRAGATAAGDELAFDAFIISSTPGSGDMRGKFQDSTTPTLNWEEATADNGGGEYRITAGRPKDNVATDHVITINEAHPITSGFDVGQEVTISTGQTEVWWSTGQQAPGSLSLASELEDSTRLFLTIVDTDGELNDGSLAPAPRVMFGMTDATFNMFTDEGKQLFGQSVDWLLGIGSKEEKLQLDVSLDSATDMLSISWDSQGGKLYTLRSSTDPENDGDPLSWPVFGGNMDIVATPPENTVTFAFPDDGTRLFVVEEFNAPPVTIFSDDFEGGQGAWATSSTGAVGTFWEFDTPSVVGPPAANSGVNCFGTNIDADYAIDADVSLVSPAIDLTAAGEATLNFFQFVDIEIMFDAGTINVLDAADDSFIVQVDTNIDGTTANWEQYSQKLPPEAVGKNIKLEFVFTADNFNNLAGWYIDDVEVTVP